MYTQDLSPMNILDTFDTSEETVKILKDKEDLETACNLEEIISTSGELDMEVIASVEAAFPGMLLDNLTLEECNTTEGVTYALESLADVKDKAVVSISVSSILVINQLKSFLTKIADSEVADGVGAMLSTIKAQVKDLSPGSAARHEAAYLKAYKEFMGVQPKDVKMVTDLIDSLQGYKNPILALKDYPNNEYDRLFSPLLSKTVAEKSKLFDLFQQLKDSQARHLVLSITNVQGELDEIIKTADYGRLARFNDVLIPRQMHTLLNDIVASYDINVNPKVPLLEQTKSIGKQLSKALKATDSSIEKKATVVNSLVNQHQKLDTAYDNVLKSTDILSQFDKVKAEQLVELKRDLIQMKRRKSLKARAVGINDGTHKASKIQYRRILDEIEHLWGLVSMFARMSVVFVTKHAIIVKVLTEYNLRLSQFVVTIGKLQAKEVTDEQT